MKTELYVSWAGLGDIRQGNQSSGPVGEMIAFSLFGHDAVTAAVTPHYYSNLVLAERLDNQYHLEVYATPGRPLAYRIRHNPDEHTVLREMWQARNGDELRKHTPQGYQWVDFRVASPNNPPHPSWDHLTIVLKRAIPIGLPDDYLLIDATPTLPTNAMFEGARVKEIKVVASKTFWQNVFYIWAGVMVAGNRVRNALAQR